MKYRKVRAVIFWTATVAAAAFAVHYFVSTPYRQLSSSASLLKTEVDVIEKFGEPAHVHIKGEENYYVNGYSRRERPVSGKVMIYFPDSVGLVAGDAIMYIWLDPEGNVEEVFVGGS